MTLKIHDPAQTNPLPRSNARPSARIGLGRPPSAAKVWRRWWLRAAKAKQMQQLRDITIDPHMAKDIGLPVTERPLHVFTWW